MKAIVLTAGKGKRMKPLTLTRPKSMLPIGGKPILEHIIDRLKENEIDDILLIVGYKKEKIEQYFGDGSKFDVKISYVVQKKVLGTGHAIKLAENRVGEKFFVIYGDLYVKAEAIKAILNYYQKHTDADVIIGGVLVDDVRRFGMLKVGKNHKVMAIVEKPVVKAKGWANAGIYIFSEEVFKPLREVEKSRRGEVEIIDAINSLIKKRRKVMLADIDQSDWLDIGRPWDLLEANKRVLQDMRLSMEGEVEDNAHIIGPIGLAEGARIRSGAYIEGPVIIGKGSDIGPNCYIRPYTSIGTHVRIGNACEIKNCIIMDRTHIAHLSYIADSVIGEECNLGAGTITANLRFDEKAVKMIVEDRLVDTGLRKLGVIIGDYAKTGVGVCFMPGVKIGSYSWIGPGIVIHRDVSERIFIQGEVEYRVEGVEE